MKQVIGIILTLAGLYFLLDHTPPFPLNHEVIGLGTNHLVHSLFGIILLVVAGYLWWKNKGSEEAAPPEDSE